MNAAQIKDEIRKVNRIDKIEITDGSMKKRRLISLLGLECQEIEQKCRVSLIEEAAYPL